MSAQPIYEETEGYELAVITAINGEPYEQPNAWTAAALEQIADMRAESAMFRIIRAARPSQRISR